MYAISGNARNITGFPAHTLSLSFFFFDLAEDKRHVKVDYNPIPLPPPRKITHVGEPGAIKLARQVEDKSVRMPFPR